MPDQKILEIKGLKTNFHVNGQEIRAVDGIDFHVLKGETIGIVGESGSGKSVTALSVMQLVSKPGVIAGGEIRYFPENGDSVNLVALSEKAMQRYRGARIAMIFQEPMTSLNPVFRCGEQVAEAIRLHQKKSKKIARQETLSLFEQVQLPDPERIYRAYPHQLSGGQKQRVMIAMALSCKPDILIADEPTTALDVTVQQTILALLNELKRKFGLSLIFISHDLGVIAQIADRALVMYGGKIVEQGSIHELFQHPKHPYTKGLLACRPPLDRRLRRLPVVEDFMEIRQTEAGVELIEKTGAAERLASLVEASSAYQTRQNLLQQQPALLSVQNLSVWFPATRNWLGQPRTWVKAVDEVSFEVLPGETLGLVGESGCGKTTLGRALLHLLPIRSGEIVFDGQALNTLEAQAMRRIRKDIQIVFQDPYASLNPRLAIGQTLLEPLALHGIGANAKDRKDRVMALLQSVQLGPEYFQRYPHECSGGQRQRVSIARALASEPRFIVFDESVSALDVSVQAQVLNLLMTLREDRGFTCIFISHDLSVVKLMSDRLLVMHEGKIVESGYAEEVYAHPKAGYTQQLIGAIPGF
ncbi:MAG: ABC transporter ATP-binding protein [Saprospiraceae bacterium]